ASLPQGAVVVLTCEGVLYSWETYRLERYISAAMANDRISGVVLFVNGPGGMITRVDVLEKLIRQSPKPIVAYITGVCASLPQGAVVVLTCEGVLYSWETYRLERYISAA
ncbi:hypothetical protein E7X23_25670, partial [Bacteroides fragilis]